MNDAEPILRAEDHAAWARWMLTARMHARTRGFMRALDGARRTVDRALERAPRTSVAWSGGKDSTCLTHLVVVDRGATHVDVMSEKDDLDYPGEEAYVRELAAAWGARLRVIHPDVSPSAWIAEHAHELPTVGDLHSRAAGLSKACFYGIVEEANRGYDCVMLGLRADESDVRERLRDARGKIYTLKSGQLRALPIADWSGLDVLAYAETRGIELLPLYRCIGFMHAREPWLVRKSWWLPGKSGAHGQVAWLARYYPSLYQRMRAWMPGAAALR